MAVLRLVRTAGPRRSAPLLFARKRHRGGTAAGHAGLERRRQADPRLPDQPAFVEASLARTAPSTLLRAPRSRRSLRVPATRCPAGVAARRLRPGSRRRPRRTAHRLRPAQPAAHRRRLRTRRPLPPQGARLDDHRHGRQRRRVDRLRPRHHRCPSRRLLQGAGRLGDGRRTARARRFKRRQHGHHGDAMKREGWSSERAPCVGARASCYGAGQDDIVGCRPAMPNERQTEAFVRRHFSAWAPEVTVEEQGSMHAALIRSAMRWSTSRRTCPARQEILLPLGCDQGVRSTADDNQCAECGWRAAHSAPKRSIGAAKRRRCGRRSCRRQAARAARHAGAPRCGELL